MGMILDLLSREEIMDQDLFMTAIQQELPTDL
jgi:hypothetical protein